MSAQVGRYMTSVCLPHFPPPTPGCSHRGVTLRNQERWRGGRNQVESCHSGTRPPLVRGGGRQGKPHRTSQDQKCGHGVTWDNISSPDCHGSPSRQDRVSDSNLDVTMTRWESSTDGNQALNFTTSINHYSSTRVPGLVRLPVVRVLARNHTPLPLPRYPPVVVVTLVTTETT